MENTDLILLARAVANECEKRGFPNTASAMQEVIEGMLAVTGDRPVEQDALASEENSFAP